MIVAVILCQLILSLVPFVVAMNFAERQIRRSTKRIQTLENRFTRLENENRARANTAARQKQMAIYERLPKFKDIIDGLPDEQ